MTVEFPDEAGNGEYYPLEVVGRPAGEEEGDGVAVVASPTPSEKKSPRGPRRARISSKPVLDLMDVSNKDIYMYVTELQVSCIVPVHTIMFMYIVCTCMCNIVHTCICTSTCTCTYMHKYM